MPKKVLTLCMVRHNSNILLGMKKRGFGEGRWNGFGGKVEEGESVLDAAKRELLEEAGIVAKNMEEIGTLDFNFENDTKILEVHVFSVSEFSGEPRESEEMRPEWFAHDKIPLDQMWPDDRHWLPYLIAEKRFHGRFFFDKPSTADYTSKILEMEIKEI